MKNTFTSFCAIALCLFLCQCAKSNCHTCTLSCVNVMVQNPNYGGSVVYSGSTCGSASTIQSWKAGISANYSQYDVNFSNATPTTQKTCGTDAQTNSAIATYTAAGYTCN